MTTVMQIGRYTAAVATAALLLLGSSAASQGQRDQHDDKQGKPDKHEDRRRPDAQPPAKQQRSQGQPQRPEARPQQTLKNPQAQEHGQPARQPQPRNGRGAQPAAEQRQEQSPPRLAVQQVRQQQQPLRTRQQAVVWQQQRGWLKQGGWQAPRTWQQGRAKRWEHEHRTWAQRGGYGGYYISQASFRLYFGSQHWFRMRSPTIYMGYPRFSYSGVSFLLVDPWPEFWAENWYETDDVYVDYDDGYYLHNRRDPSIRLAITVAL